MKKIIACILAGLAVVSCFAQENKKTPNILIIFSDDHAYQTIGAYGSRLMQTPNIDRIAREGMLFTDCKSMMYEAKLLLAEADHFPKSTRLLLALQPGLC